MEKQIMIKNKPLRIQYLLRALEEHRELFDKRSEEAREVNFRPDFAGRPLYPLEFWQACSVFCWEIMHELEFLGHKFTESDWIGHSKKAACCKEK
jgi:hypothetical protein